MKLWKICFLIAAVMIAKHAINGEWREVGYDLLFCGLGATLGILFSGFISRLSDL